MFHSLYLSANAGRCTTERRPACGRVSSHVRSYLVSRSLTSKESVDFLLRLRCNRLLRRQHCSSLCLQSEGNEHVANMASVLEHDFVGFLAVFGRHNMRSPSLCKQSELQCFTSDLRRMFAQRLLANLDFLDFEHPLIPPKTVSFPSGHIQKAPRHSFFEGMPRGLSFGCFLPFPLFWRKEGAKRDNYVLLWPQGVAADEAISRFLRFIRTSPFRGCGRLAYHLGP